MATSCYTGCSFVFLPDYRSSNAVAESDDERCRCKYSVFVYSNSRHYHYLSQCVNKYIDVIPASRCSECCGKYSYIIHHGLTIWFCVCLCSFCRQQTCLYSKVFNCFYNSNVTLSTARRYEYAQSLLSAGK